MRQLMNHKVLTQLRCYQQMPIVERVRLVHNCRDVNLLLDYWNFEYLSDLPSEMVNQEILEQLKRLAQEV
jgi:hypothetical protein